MADSDITRLIQEAGIEAGGKWSSERANDLFEAIVGRIFRAVVLSGSFRLPAGYGTFRMRLHRPTKRRIMGQLVEVPAQPYIRYTEGEVVRVALGKLDHYGPKRKRPVKSIL
jgi:hypothetical protein